MLFRTFLSVPTRIWGTSLAAVTVTAVTAAGLAGARPASLVGGAGVHALGLVGAAPVADAGPDRSLARQLEVGATRAELAAFHRSHAAFRREVAAHRAVLARQAASTRQQAAAKRAAAGRRAAEQRAVAEHRATAEEAARQIAAQRAAEREAAEEAAAAAAQKAEHAAERAAEEAAEEAAEQEAAEREAAERDSASRASRSSSRRSISGGSPRAIAASMVAARGWSSEQMSCLDSLWQRESGWNPHAANPTSSAYGIPQALPGSKMAAAGSDWADNPATQIEWGLDYIADRYGTPCGAWGHSESHGWY